MSITITSSKYDGRYMELVCSQTTDIAKNQSTISWTLYSKGGEDGNYSTGPTSVVINGTQVYYKDRVKWDSRIFPAAKGNVSGTHIVSHNTDGTKTITVGFSTAIYTQTVSTYSESWTLDAIPRAATITAAPDFTDIDNPTITYSNAAGDGVSKLEACISLTSAADDIKYREVSKTGTSYTFNLTEAERNVLLDNTLNGSSSRYVYFYLRTTIGSTVLHNYSRKVFTVSDAAPEVSCVARDTNPDTVTLTGNSNRLIKGHSNIGYTITATPKKRASITKYKFSVGSQTLTTSDDTVYNADSATISYSATDNRGHVIGGVRVMDFVDYVDISCNQTAKISLLGETQAQIDITVEGNYYNGSFGNYDNEFQLECRYKENNGEYGNWFSLLEAGTPSFEGYNKYSHSTTITVPNYNSTYTIQCRAKDSLTTQETSEYKLRLVPVFDWGEEDFNFNVPVKIKNEPIGDFVKFIPKVNGWQLKVYSSGIVEMWKRIEITTNVSTAWGSLYTSGPLVAADLTYPMTLVEMPIVNVSLSSNYAAAFIMCAGSNAASMTSTGRYEIVRGSSYANGTYILNYHVVGRWK